MAEIACAALVGLVGGRLVYVWRAENPAPTDRDRWSWRIALALVLVVVSFVASGCLPRVNATVDDSGLTTRVKTALLNEPEISATAISVASARGVVTLSGRVRSTDERTRAIAVAKQTTGVVEVRADALTVSAAP